MINFKIGSQVIKTYSDVSSLNIDSINTIHITTGQAEIFTTLKFDAIRIGDRYNYGSGWPAYAYGYRVRGCANNVGKAERSINFSSIKANNITRLNSEFNTINRINTCWYYIL